jgi:hypothetical protein
MAFIIKVNGNAYNVDVDGDTPLLWVLRDMLGMTGTKFGCGMALCGACTVHIDGVAARSCITSIDSVGDSAITTIEAIGATAVGAKIQKAWLTATYRNAATASRARSCRPRRCWRATRIQPTPTLTMRCPATSAAAGLMSAFAKRSSRPRNRSDREADNDRRPQRVPLRPGREQFVAAQASASRSGRQRWPDVER